MLKRNLDALGIAVLGLGMTQRVLKVQHMVHSEIQGKQTCALEVVQEESLGNVWSTLVWNGKEATPTGSDLSQINLQSMTDPIGLA